MICRGFGVEPYFDSDFYVGLNTGGYELGLHLSDDEIVLGNNVHSYWGR